MTEQANKTYHTPEPWIFDPGEGGDSSVGMSPIPASLSVEVPESEEGTLEVALPGSMIYKVKEESLTEHEQYFMAHPEYDAGDYPSGYRAYGDPDANLERIAYCVNFCAGKTNKELEALGSLENVLKERNDAQKKIEANPEGIARLKLALGISNGLFVSLTEEQIKLLDLDFDIAAGYQPRPDIWRKVLQECVEIITAWHIESMPNVVDAKLEYQKMAIALLRQLKAKGGLMTYKELEVIPEVMREELLGNMQVDMLITRSINGIKLGKFAERALAEYGHLA